MARHHRPQLHHAGSRCRSTWRAKGNLTDWHLVHLGQFAIGGAASCAGGDRVEARGRRQASLPPACIQTKHVRAIGASRISSRTRRGCQRSSSWHRPRPRLSRSPLGGREPLNERRCRHGARAWQLSVVECDPARARPPGACWHSTLTDIKAEVQAWHDAWLRLAMPGFDHRGDPRAHGLLIMQFLSPVANHRVTGYWRRSGRPQFAFRAGSWSKPCARPGPPTSPCSPLLGGRGKGGHWDIDDTDRTCGLSVTNSTRILHLRHHVPQGKRPLFTAKHQVMSIDMNRAFRRSNRSLVREEQYERAV